MAKYVTATRSCGHTERVLVNYKITDMEEWESRQAEQLCFECQKQKRLEEAREQVAGLDLPPLTGSPKQIAWAETIRADIIKNVGERLNYFLENTDQFARMIEKHNIEPAAYVDEINRSLMLVLQARTASRFWIDTHDFRLSTIIELLREEARKITEEQVALQIVEQKKVFLAAPEDGNGIEVTITHAGNNVYVLSGKNSNVIDICKSNGLYWDAPQWTRSLDITDGTIEDFIARLGNQLLSKGFSVLFETEELKNNATSGNFAPVEDRWVLSHKGVTDNVFIWFRQYGDSKFQQARRITGAEYSKGKIRVPLTSHQEILALKEDGFSFSPGATRLIESFVSSIESETVSVVEVIQKEQSTEAANVLEDLKDD